MYRIVCASDGHNARSAREDLMAALPPCDLFCWLGDVESDALFFRAALAQTHPNTEFQDVAGNCDPFSALPGAVRLNAAGLRVFITHGHRYTVKQTYDLLAEAAAGNGCRLALFGHTHVQHSQWINGVLLVNPGALKNREYAVIEIGNEGEIAAELKRLA